MTWNSPKRSGARADENPPVSGATDRVDGALESGQVRAGFALGGAVIGLIGALELGWCVGVGILPLSAVALVAIVLLILGYIAADLAAGSRLGEVLRGYLIGLNANMNGVLVWLTVRALGLELSVVLGGALTVLCLLAVFPGIARRSWYQAALGWANWLLPMSWPVVGLGLLFFLLNILGHTLLFWPFRYQVARIAGQRIDWREGALFVRGGWISNLNPMRTAFNMGSFNYVHRISLQWHTAHEVGHALNLGAFGSVFHLVGAVDENVLRRGWRAYAERLAESHNPQTMQPDVIPMWGDSAHRACRRLAS